MAKVTIRYCVPCRYLRKAMEDAEAILAAYGQHLEGLDLVPGDHGVYDVVVDGRIVFSIDQELRFPQAQELIDRIRPFVSEAAKPS